MNRVGVIGRVDAHAAPAGLSQPTVSHHMKQLAEAGLAAREQRGKRACYRVAPETMAALGSVLADPAA